MNKHGYSTMEAWSQKQKTKTKPQEKNNQNVLKTNTDQKTTKNPPQNKQQQQHKNKKQTKQKPKPKPKIKDVVLPIIPGYTITRTESTCIHKVVLYRYNIEQQKVDTRSDMS